MALTLVFGSCVNQSVPDVQRSLRISSRFAVRRARFGRSAMLTESVAVAIVLAILALGTLYAFKGSPVSDQWRIWMTKASLAAALAFAIGMSTLGLPGILFLEALDLKLRPDSVWPLGVQITQFGALLILPVSLALRFAMPNATGWRHVWPTTLLTIMATFLVAILLANQALR
jgi:hypothetical protein